MSDKENDTTSFYPTGIDNISQSYLEALSVKADAATALSGEMWQLNKPGPFLDEDGRIALRSFVYKDVTLLAFLLEETSDSFMVLLPAHLSKDDKGVKATQIIATAMGRLLKSSVSLMYMPSPVQMLYYLSVMREQFKTCPGYFNGTRIGQIDGLVGILKTSLGVKEKGKPKAEVKTEAAADLSKDGFSIPDHMIPRIQH